MFEETNIMLTATFSCFPDDFCQVKTAMLPCFVSELPEDNFLRPFVRKSLCHLFRTVQKRITLK
jgi:hypothetical protein